MLARNKAEVLATADFVLFDQDVHPDILARLLASAWPGEVARKRSGTDGSYLLASGRAANLPPTDNLAKSDWLVVADLGGAAREPRITLALPLTEAEALASQTVVSEDRAARVCGPNARGPA